MYSINIMNNLGFFGNSDAPRNENIRPVNTNTQVVNTVNTKQILVVDIRGPTSTVLTANNKDLTKTGEFSISLPQTMKVDAICEVYLDSFITFNGDVADIPEKSAFLLKIDQFNINTMGASDQNRDQETGHIVNDKYSGRIVIPNENRSVENYLTTTTHKSKKLNYICDILPSHISKVSGSITNLDGNPIFASDDSKNSLVYTLLNITTMSKPEWLKESGAQMETYEKLFIPSGASIQVYCMGGGSPPSAPPTASDTPILEGHVSSNVNKDSSLIYMSSSVLSSGGATLYDTAGHVNFIIKLSDIKYAGQSSAADPMYIYTQDITILESECRFIAEFNLIEKKM